ncbi:hypothetical protein [Hoeflea prorocentri]|uniref:Uncharacterized protein n=1 Tax=Hoeflea prorocentri TaxID=1922333 RepID=A0A9X3ZIP4_9HYPH|nr:hypothetical protein [Hoeflea prorocentri]MCY6381930.1 hypothetical protein [Hoeflea prorocentri]MDA5399730.1 hypothetical protein [Hoeflea prorocentri]
MVESGTRTGHHVLNAADKQRLKRHLTHLRHSLDALPIRSERDQTAGVGEWAQSTMKTTYDIIYQLSPGRSQAPEVNQAFHRAMSAYDATADIADRRHIGLRHEDFQIARTAIRRCIESGSHLL